MGGLSLTAEHATTVIRSQDSGSIPTSPLQFDATWRHRCRVRRADRREIEPMIRTHYLSRWPGVVVLSLVAEICGGQTFGCVVFALPPRETAKRYGGTTWELARLWISDEIPKNAESWLLSRAVAYIRKNHRDIVALVSYADPSVGHTGAIYRAANWIADGRTDEGRKSARCDYQDAATGKKYSRRGHVQAGTEIKRIPRVSKFRFIYKLRAHLAKRKEKHR